MTGDMDSFTPDQIETFDLTVTTVRRLAVELAELLAEEQDPIKVTGVLAVNMESDPQFMEVMPHCFAVALMLLATEGAR